METTAGLSRQERNVVRQGIQYSFTRDADRLQQYYTLLHKCYEEDLEVHLDAVGDRKNTGHFSASPSAGQPP
jgi:hypothetical protein